MRKREGTGKRRVHQRGEKQNTKLTGTKENRKKNTETNFTAY